MLSQHQTHPHHLRNIYSPTTFPQSETSHSVTPPLTPITMQDSSSCYIPNSSLQEEPSASSAPIGASPITSCNAYTSLINKVSLKLNGSIEEMTLKWTLEEKEVKRRLVQFWRKHENSVIHCGFNTVSPTDRAPNSICVSCIYWEEKNDYYITSVDCIYLLESLIAVRFSVEEKNRIRRNLEGFRPITVSKCKADSTEFFKLIMSFPNPKPRNIEKDVKVFPWKVLPNALQKIIGKYTTNSSSHSNNSEFGTYHSDIPQSILQYSQFEGHGSSVYSPSYPAQISPQSYSAQLARARFYSQDLNSIDNRMLSNPHSEFDVSSAAGRFTESGQINPQVLDPSFINQDSAGSYHNPAQFGPQRRHLFLRRHSFADPYTIPYNIPRRPDRCANVDIPQSSNILNTPTSMPYSNHPYIIHNDLAIKQESSYSRDLRDNFNHNSSDIASPTIGHSGSVPANQTSGAGGYQSHMPGDYSQHSTINQAKETAAFSQNFGFKEFEQPPMYGIDSHNTTNSNGHTLPPTSHLNHYGQTMYTMAPMNNTLDDTIPSNEAPTTTLQGSDSIFHRYT